jgi:DNA-binding transcriptional MerR regulator
MTDPHGAPTSSIGEFARRCGLSISALRFYDECGLLKPATVDPATGYRSYGEEQLEMAVLVRDLRRLDLPLAAVREVLAQPADVRHKVVDEHIAALADRLRDARALAQRLHEHIDELEGVMTMTVEGPALATALGRVSVAVGHDQKRPMLHGVLLEAKEGSLRLVATDSYRLAVRDLLPGGRPAAEFRATAVGTAVADALAWFEASPTVSLRLDGDEIVCTAGDEERRLPTIAAEFPDYEVIMSGITAHHRLVAPLAEVLDAIDSLPEAKAARVAFRSGTLQIAAEGETRNVSADYDGEGIEFHLNPSFFGDAVSAAVGPDLAIEVMSPLTPIVFRSADEGTAVHLLMPIKAS